MKNFILKTTFFFSASLLCFNSYAVDPSTLLLTVHKVAVSTSPLCTSLVTILDNDASSSATNLNFLTSPTLGTGTISDGTYPCIVIEFSDSITFTSASTTGSCAAGVSQSINVCRSPATSTLINGTVVSCTSSTDRVALYLSTASASTGGGSSNANAFEPPTTTGDSSDSARGLHLGSALSVSGSIAAAFVVNATNKIDGSGATCDMQPPLFSFSLP